MNYPRLALALLLATAPLATASAASVIMVQFGSFETLAEAQKRLADVKASHGAAIGNVPMGVREIKLPPDNLTVYRTQAGPVDTRTSAQSICSKLANTGDECYVVETAMSGTAPVQMAAAAPAVIAPEPAAAPAMAIQPAPMAASTASGPALTPMNVEPVAEAPSPQMQAALDRAATAQDTTIVTPRSISATPAPKPSFWSRLNPFSDSEPAASNLKPDFEPAPEVLSAPTSTMLVASRPAEPVLAASAINLAPQASQPYESLPLLPPPPPLTSRDEEYLRQNMAMPAQQPEVIAKPLAPVTQPARVAAAPVAVLPADGSVRVEEAKRVPLTQTPAAPVFTAQPQAAPAVSLLPSSTLGQKTLWAQMGQFNDPQAALAFWENYRRAHPDFPVVRVRVTSSIQQQKHGNDRVWLRVGPFAREGFIRSLCGSIAPESNVRCGNVTDVGVAGNASPATGYLNGSRYKR